jgi:hypothetical protein
MGFGLSQALLLLKEIPSLTTFWTGWVVLGTFSLRAALALAPSLSMLLLVAFPFPGR